MGGATDNITTTLRDDFAVEAAIPILQKADQHKMQ